MNDSYSMFNATKPELIVFAHDRAACTLANVADQLTGGCTPLSAKEDELSALRIDVDRAIRSVDYAITEAA